jgi:hypothetical protein
MLPNLAIVAWSQASAMAPLSQQSDCHLGPPPLLWFLAADEPRFDMAGLRSARPAVNAATGN